MRQIRRVDWSGTQYGKPASQEGKYYAKGPNCDSGIFFPNSNEAMRYLRKQSRDYLRRTSVIGARARIEVTDMGFTHYGSRYKKVWQVVEVYRFEVEKSDAPKRRVIIRRNQS